MLQTLVNEGNEHFWSFVEKWPEKNWILGPALWELLGKKGITHEQAMSWGLGVLPIAWRGVVSPAMLSDRLLIPIHDAHGGLVSISGRGITIDADPKFWHVPFEKRYVLWGLNRFWQEILSADFAFLVESYFDVMALERCGHRAVAFMGSSLAIEQAALLARYTTRVCYIPHAGWRERNDFSNVIEPLQTVGIKVFWTPAQNADDFDEYYFQCGWHAAKYLADWAQGATINSQAPTEPTILERMRNAADY